eukprot:COSAG01_NODE_34287_length_550_cov_0.884701_2_plen_78_part_01
MSRRVLTSNIGLQALADGGGTVDGGVGEDAPVPETPPRSDDGADANAPAVAEEVEAAAARDVGGELFLRVHWVAVPEA